MAKKREKRQNHKNDTIKYKLRSELRKMESYGRSKKADMQKTKADREKYSGNNLVEETSWKYLNEHAEFLMYFTKLIEALEDKDYESSKEALDSLCEYLYDVEEKIENVFSIAGVLSRYPALVENLKK